MVPFSFLKDNRVGFHADWTKLVWRGHILVGGYANINYSCQVTHGALLTIG
jgi:nitrate reductase alpha subunit